MIVGLVNISSMINELVPIQWFGISLANYKHKNQYQMPWFE